MDKIKKRNLSTLLVALSISFGAYAQGLQLIKQIKLPTTQTFLYSFDVVSDYLCLVPIEGVIVSPIIDVKLFENPVYYYHSAKIYSKGDYLFFSYFNKLNKKNYVASFKGKSKLFSYEIGSSGYFTIAPLIDTTYCVLFGIDAKGYSMHIVNNEGDLGIHLKEKISALIPFSKESGLLAMSNRLYLYRIEMGKILTRKILEFGAEIYDMCLKDDAHLYLSSVDGTYLYDFQMGKMSPRLVNDFGILRLLNNKLYILKTNNNINIFNCL